MVVSLTTELATIRNPLLPAGTEIGCNLLLRDWELGRHALLKGTKLFTEYKESSYLSIIGRSADNVKVKDVKLQKTQMIVNQAHVSNYRLSSI